MLGLPADSSYRIAAAHTATSTVGVCAHPVSKQLRYRSRPSRPMEMKMFKIIGGTVVYGFALFGLAKYLESLHENLRKE